MSADHHQRLARIFRDACNTPAEQRAAFLAQECAGDEVLRCNVERLLAADQDQEPGILSRLPLSIAEQLKLTYALDIDPGVALEEPPKNLTPKTRYAVQGEVARGGIGIIFRVWDQELRRTLAMKTLLKQPPTTSTGAPLHPAQSQLLSRFLEEAQITSQLDHPGIVPVHELGLDQDGRVYFTMRLVKGRDLHAVFDLVQTGAEGWNETRALGVILRVCEAVAYSHAKGVIHRDLKPANIMVGRYGEVYVMDWGLAKVIGQQDHHNLKLRPEPVPTEVETDRHEAAEEDPGSPVITMDGKVLGTPSYMPPEQAQGRVELLGPSSDVYAIGAMLYEVLGKQPPYAEPGANISARTILAMVLQGPPKPLSQINRDVPVELVAICERAMARAIEHRYQSTLELAEDLRAYLEHRVVRAYETGALAELRKWVVRNRALASSLAAALLVLVVGILVTMTLYSQQKRQRERADLKTAEAERNEDEAKHQFAEVLRLSDVKKVAQLRDRADHLWPRRPNKIAAMRQWLADARAVRARLPEHETTLANLREQALPFDEARRKQDREAHPRFGELQQLQAELERLENDQMAHEGSESKSRDEGHEKHIAKLDDRVKKLEREVDERRTWEFAEPATSWRHDVLAGLVADLWALEPLISDIEKRLEVASTIEKVTIDEQTDAWNDVQDTIVTNPLYKGVELEPQIGLVPLGEDPDSHFFEFWVWESGERPERDEATKHWKVTGETGIVLVLLPGGTFTMGATSDLADPNYDSNAEPNESPPHEVTLSPFLLSKFEMTQGQWFRLIGSNPSPYGKDSDPLAHPVESVSWEDCTNAAMRLDLLLPTEAQWEYAARAGTRTPWSCASNSLKSAGNLADKHLMEYGKRRDLAYERWDDGYAGHAPVGRFAANPFGLHDVHGNVWEWCADWFGDYASGPAMDPKGSDHGEARMNRGGGWLSSAQECRSAYRSGSDPSIRSADLGFRPAKVISSP
jgi:formylglycine-generating enzyme required for sulfatase activity/serine/threonine protein kinase